MRILETIYKVKGIDTAYDVKMTQVKGLKIRELVMVRAAKVEKVEKIMTKASDRYSPEYR